MRRNPTPLLRRIGTRVPLALALIVVSGVVVSAAAAAGPDISYTLTATQGDNGWYRSTCASSGLRTGWPPAAASRRRCSATQPGSVQSCAAADINGVHHLASVTIKIDRTAPLVTTAKPPAGP